MGDEPAVAHHDDPVAQDLGLVGEVGDEHDRRPAVADPPDEVPDDAPRRGVEPLRELVEEHDLGLVHERQGDEQPLALPARERAERLPPQRVESPLAHRVPRHAPVGEQLDGLADTHPLRQVRVLQLAADTGGERAALASGIAAEEPDRAAIRTAEPLGALDHRRLARAVEPQDAEDLAFVDGQVDAVDGDDVAVPLAELLHLEDGGHAGDVTEEPDRRHRTAVHSSARTGG